MAAEPEWLRLARVTETADRAQRRLEAEQRDECESEEALLAYWKGVFAASPWRGAIYEDERRGIDSRLHGP